jgi:hypothetical protein
MKKTNIMKKLTIFLSALFVLFSCTNEGEMEPGKITPPLEDGEVILRLQVPGHKQPAVYAASESDENQIAELDILAFANQTTGIDTLAYRIKVDAGSITDATGHVNGNKKDIKVKLKRNDSDLKIVLIANARSVLDGASISEGDQLGDIFDELIYSFSGSWTTNPMSPIPMWGQTAGYVSIKNPVVTDPIDITLLRSVAKVDVGIDLYGDPALGFGQRFKLNHVYVYNANDKGSIIPDLTDAGLADNKVTKPNIPTTAQAINVFQEYIPAANESKLFNEIYLPESDKTSANRTCLIIGGTYDGGNETFYRVDFVNKNDENLDLLRNYRFLVNITNVKRYGFDTKEEAAKAKTSHIEYTLSVFNEDINSIVYNGQYGLGVSTDQVLLDWKATTGNSITIATDYPDGFEATTPDSWINITANPQNVQNGNVVFSVQQNLSEELYRTGVITIKAGSLVQDVEIRQYLGANSILVRPSSNEQIAALFANADGKERVTNGATLTSEVLWQDAAGVISATNVTGTGKSAVINVNAGNTSGNAVVALKAGGAILWSWHIWVTDYDLSLPVSQKSHNGTEFMTRNLGAIVETPGAAGTLGLFYQWGRKDPFPGASATTANTNTLKPIVDASGAPTAIEFRNVTANSNFDNAVANPMTFYCSAEFPWFSWYGLEETNNSLWVDAEGNKTAYDPCPQGWRVPVDSKVWAGLPSVWNTNGATLSPVGYYPAAGGLDFADGKLTDVGTSGYYWAAGPSGVTAKAMIINASTMSTDASPLRASGYPVRCVKE